MPFVLLQQRGQPCHRSSWGLCRGWCSADEVSVFLAFKAARKVTLEVFEVGGSGANP
jgi:hypothetical protein